MYSLCICNGHKNLRNELVKDLSGVFITPVVKFRVYIYIIMYIIVSHNVKFSNRNGT